ncbi:MAG: peptide chain release factor N(5)-glutamine methyltransferase [FCB group bacterium]|nr:peptide chain release factor N(5)-glutamine methyltransferase [FCB group bacterium]
MGDAGKPGPLWTIVELIRWGETYFKEQGFSAPRLEIEYLLTALLGYQRVELYLNFDQPVTPAQRAILKTWIRRRRQHEPLQYITGQTEFYGRSFQVEAPVFIPRPETERLVAQALSRLKTKTAPAILEVGTGSGCIASTLALEIPDARVTAIDRNEKALALARKNARTLGATVRWVPSDFSAYHPQKNFDLVLSNPPYVTAVEYRRLSPEVRDFEAAEALTDDADGLTLTRELALRGRELLKPDGWLMLEVGLPPQPDHARELLVSSGYAQVELSNDYNGDKRVLTARCN